MRPADFRATMPTPEAPAPDSAERLKILFVCSQNRWRSLTAEKLYAGFPGYEVRSAGTEPGARVRVSAGHVGWADVIFAMERRHVDRLRAKFPEELADKPLICLRVPDEFEFMEAELVDALKTALAPHLVLPE